MTGQPGPVGDPDHRMDMPDVDAVRQLVRELHTELGHSPSHVSEITIEPDAITVVGVGSLGGRTVYPIPMHLDD